MIMRERIFVYILDHAVVVLWHGFRVLRSFEKRNQNMVQTMNQNIVVYYAFLFMISIALIIQA